jgi:hypothetical protein
MACHTASVALAACLSSTVALSAQGPTPIPREKEPPSQTRMQEQHIPLTVTGCVRGNRLLISRWTSNEGIADVLNTDELIIEASKDMMRQLRKEHDGHDDELTGTAILQTPDDASTTHVGTTPVGKKGRITIGQRESQGGAGELRRPVRFRVTGIQHMHSSCRVI